MTRVYILVALLFGSIPSLYSQSIFSPLSIQGIGQLQHTDQVQTIGMGRLSTAFSDPFAFSLSNPASMAWLDQTVMDVSVSGSYNQLTVGNANSKFYNAGLGHFAIAIPINAKKNMVSSFGIRPYSLSGYTAQMADPNGYRFENYTFEGNMSTAFFSLAKAYSIDSLNSRDIRKFRKEKLPYNRHNLSFGATGGFLFGTQTVFREIQHPDSSVLPFTRTSEKYFPRTLQYTLGAHYQFSRIKGISDSSYLDLGFALTNSPSSSVAIERFAISYFINGSSISVPDTVVPLQSLEGTLRFPLSIAGGIMYTKNYKLRLGIDAKYQIWQNSSIPWSQDVSYNYFELSAGGSYAINQAYDMGTNYLTRIEYRAGLRYFNSFASLNNNRVNGMGMNFGLGLPILKSSFSKINFGLELERQGDLTKTLLQDDKVRFYLGVTIREKWFQRIQID